MQIISKSKTQHELKIILGQSPTDIKVLINDEQIGLIQKINLSTTNKTHSYMVTIFFPNFSKLNQSHSSVFYITNRINRYVKMLEEFQNIDIKFQNIV